MPTIKFDVPDSINQRLELDMKESNLKKAQLLNQILSAYYGDRSASQFLYGFEELKRLQSKVMN